VLGKAKMVLEAFAALSLSASIVQFVEFGSKLLNESRQVSKSATGASKEHENLQSLADGLQRVLQELATSSASLSELENVSETEMELDSLAKECRSVANELRTLLGKIKRGNANTRRASILQAIRFVWSESNIDAIKIQLERLQIRLTFCLTNIIK